MLSADKKRVQRERHTKSEMFLVFIALCILLFYFWYKQKFSFWEKRGFPSIPGTIPFGSVFDLGTKFHSSDFLTSFYDENKRKAPAVGFYVFTKPLLLPIGAELLQHILVRSFDSFEERGISFNSKEDTFTNHLFFTSGSAWKDMRSKVSPCLSIEKLKLMFDTVARKMNLLSFRVFCGHQRGS